MDVKTGEIREFTTESEFQRAMKSGNWIALGKWPKPSCRKCYGRGHIGQNDRGEYVPCSCVKPVKERPGT